MATRKSTTNHERLKQLAKQLGRPLETLIVLAGANDPFVADTPSRRASAEWLAKIWNRLDVKPGAHLRRLFYLMISQKTPIKMLTGEPFINTEECWAVLCLASRDARYLDLIPAADLIDRRNAEPSIYFDADARADDGMIVPSAGSFRTSAITLDLPELQLVEPKIPQPYQVEIWCEKSTMNDILDPLGQEYRINIVTGVGELSDTRCRELVERARQSERPVRILYVSDFDPAGMSMPVAVARKIEFALRSESADELDIQVRPVVLTHDQCVGYQLPRTPLKASERRAANFEVRFGEGATELDALEALRPGELRRILVREIERYYDTSLAREIEDVAETVRGDLHDVEADVRSRHAKDIATLVAERKKLAKAFAEAEKKTRPIIRRIERDLAADKPDIDSYDWPQPQDGDEDDDPLFDSTPDYVEQVDRFKLHQGKPTGFKLTSLVCEVCGESYTAMRSNSRACSKKCRSELRYLPGGERDPAGTPRPVKNPAK
jgi:hypothetical protein